MKNKEEIQKLKERIETLEYKLIDTKSLLIMLIILSISIGLGNLFYN